MATPQAPPLPALAPLGGPSTPRARSRTRVASAPDIHLILLWANLAAVVVGYFLTVRFGLGGPSRVMRLVLAAVSLGALLLIRRRARFQVPPQAHLAWGGLITLATLLLPLGRGGAFSLERYLTLALFFTYLHGVAWQINRRYGGAVGLGYVSLALVAAYAFPVLALTALEGGRIGGGGTIYGQKLAGFFSNQLGWASMIVVLSGWDAWTGLGPGRLRWPVRLAGLLLMALSLYVVVISGSRSAVGGVVLGAMVIVGAGRRMSLALRIGMVVVGLLAVAQLLADPDSTLSARVARTQTQLEQGEARTQVARQTLELIDRDETILITGLGLGNFFEGYVAMTGRYPQTQLHNSYLQMLIEGGVGMLLFFALALALPALWGWVRHGPARLTLLPALFVISGLESNFGPGQFLFLPWFLLLFYYHSWASEPLPNGETAIAEEGPSTPKP